MKLAKHVVLGLGLAYTGGTFADAASPNTTPQPSQAIPALPVPTAAGGPNAPAAQAREDSKDAVESIKTIAEAAIKSAEDDVEIVKWIFSAILAAIAGLAALLGIQGYQTYSESRELVQKKAKEESENLSALGTSIGQMMTIQNFIEAKHDPVKSLAGKIREMDASDQGYSEISSRLESVAKEIIEDLNRMREHDKVSNRLAPNRRWAAWIDGWHGLTLHLDGRGEVRGEEAIPYLERAIKLSKGRDRSAKSARASHLYNLACCYAVLGKNDEALTNLKASLVLEPWRHLEAFNDKDPDKDFKGLWDDKRFVAIIRDAQSSFR